MDKKTRLDILLVDQGLFSSRARAKEAILNRQVVDQFNNILDKPSLLVDDSQKLKIIGEQLKYVSRGGTKLERALKYFDINAAGVTALDIGASTGGFSDVLLQAGAKKVYANDVGTNQLHPKIKENQKVIDLSPLDFRKLTKEQIDNSKIDLVVIDASFISLHLLWQPLLQLIDYQQVPIVALVKPQFEAGPNVVGKKGVIKDRKIHQQILETVLAQAKDAEISTIDLIESPITGAAGNREFLAYFLPEKNAKISTEIDLLELINQN